jgi:hypothetical protein
LCKFERNVILIGAVRPNEAVAIRQAEAIVKALERAGYEIKPRT